MRRSWLAPPFIGALAALLPAACSQSPSRPPDLGPCEVDDASCTATSLGGGTGGGEDAATSAGACPSSAGDSQCAICEETSCCTPFVACTGNMDCNNLLNCERMCSGAVGCASMCETGPQVNGESMLGNFTSCVETKCPICSELGIGDPCVPLGVACNPGLTCSGLWCTKACLRSTDCVGLGGGGGNTLGLPNACIETAGAGGQCFAGCNTDADCVAFPGSFCFATTSSEGLSVQICQPPPDAGAD